VDSAEYREKSLEIWQLMAPGWERNRNYVWDVSRAVSVQMLSALGPEPGDTILELAAGTGETGFAAAAVVGPEGRLISTDFSPEMIDASRRRAAELDLGNVDFRVMDAEQMDLPDTSVDGVLCRWGYMLMADPAAALGETRRVLREGKRLSFSVWGSPERNPWAAISGAAMVKHGHMPPPDVGTPGMFALAEEARIRELVTGAGFEEPRIEEVAVEWHFADLEDYWHFVSELAGALAMTIKTLSEDEFEAVRGTMRAEAEPFRTGDGYRLPGLCLNVVTS
jgi:ubiquinone/menaquinone biosynthesis C-methylase UbiE